MEDCTDYHFARVSHDNPCYCERIDDLGGNAPLKHSMYITINNMQIKGKKTGVNWKVPHELFVRYDDPDFYEVVTVLSRLVSMALREGVDPMVVAQELCDIHSPKTNHNIPGTNRRANSLTARVGEVLMRHIESLRSGE